jgi:hypothetical protein
MKVIFATSLALAASQSTEESLSASVASTWGDYMSNWVQSQDGKYVSSEAQPGSTECWDLAEAAIEHARKAGYSIPKQPSSYQWSSQTVSYTNAQPGDIMQFASYSEKVTNSDGSWSSKSTGTHHTAVVTRAFDSSSCGIRVEEQNPKPAHSSIYHPCDKYRTGGTVVVYRLAASLSAPMPLEVTQCDTVCRDVCNQPFTAGGPDCCAACGCPGEDCSESMPLKVTQCDTVCRDVCNQPFTAGGPDCCAACGCPGEDCSQYQTMV